MRKKYFQISLQLVPLFFCDPDICISVFSWFYECLKRNVGTFMFLILCKYFFAFRFINFISTSRFIGRFMYMYYI